ASGRHHQSLGEAIGQAGLWFAVAAVPALLLATVCSAFGKAGFFPPVLIFSPLLAGLGLMGFVAMTRRWAWFYETKIARNWIGLFGETVGTPIVKVMCLFLAAVGLFTAFVPLIVPAKPNQQAAGTGASVGPGGGDPNWPASFGLKEDDPRFVPAIL